MKINEVIDLLTKALQANARLNADSQPEEPENAQTLYDEAIKAVAELKKKGIPVNLQDTFLDDEVAEEIGATLASEFMLKRDREHKDRWQTTVGTFTNKGIARRAACIIKEELKGF